MTVSTYTPYATATLNGVQIDTALLRGARVESSFADPVSRAYVRCIGAPDWANEDAVTVTLGGGVNNVTRFPSGTVIQGDYLNAGPSFELVCRGPLWAVQRYRNNYPKGLTLNDLTGGPATDQAITSAVLDVVGVANRGAIDGTGIVRGQAAAVAYTWRRGESALEYLQRLAVASLGYKLVESTDGLVYRTQVLGTPGAAEFTLTEGVDIFEGAHTTIEVTDTYAAWSVTGFDYGDGLGAVSASYPDPMPYGTIPYAFSSPMIESINAADTRGGIDAQTVLDYIRGESSQPIVKVSGLVTPRDDLFGPGQVHQINAPMLGLDGVNLWLLSVTAETDENWFLQTLEYIG